MEVLPSSRPLSASRLRRLLDYDRATGLFRWRSRTARSGRIAGTVGKAGFRIVQVDYCLYPASWLAWLYVHGTWPGATLVHLNQDNADDRISNLIEARRAVSKARRPAYRNNGLGIKGVRLHRNGQFEARIRIDGQLRYLGCYRSAAEAEAVYRRAASEAFAMPRTA